MESVYDWERSEKLFAIRCCHLQTPEDRASVLQQLIVDDDPVVRGKAALAMKPCDDEILLNSAEALLDLEESETSILAMELLGFTDSTDFGAYIRKALNNQDQRVVKSAIETIHLLPIETAVELMEDLIPDYDDSLKKPIIRTLEKISSSEILPILQQLLPKFSSEGQVELLRIGAGLGTEEAKNWVKEQCDGMSLSEQQRSSLEWLLSNTG